MTEPMTDEARGALRFWAVAEALHGLAIAGLAAFALPWKSPGYNLALLALAALQLAAGHGLFRLRRWGYRLALIGGALGLLAGVLIAALLVASWAYLRGTFGDFGRGAS
ncbi:MAG: hypothetical protein KC620_13085, partial [Myxococcales bacterium]|nr:hypothetical protein [Myxococcales bacterium]